MAKFSNHQKRIALLLLNSPKTEEELNKQLNLPHDVLVQELKEMLKMKVISKEGYPTVYKIKPEISEEVDRRKKIADSDAFKLRLRAIIELQAIEESLLIKHLNKLSDGLKKEKNLTIYALDKAKVEVVDEYYSSFIEVNFSVRNFSTLMNFMFFYAPSSIEVIKPDRIEFSAYDFQDGLVALAEMFQKYAEYVEKMMSKHELEQFYEQLYK